jgi:RNA polymerase sigma-70 factor (sigma-E family)
VQHVTTKVAEDSKGPDGLADLYVRHAGAGLRLAYFLTGDRQAAEDLLHEAFVRVAGRLRDLRVPDAFDAYLRRVIVNIHTSNVRRRSVERAYLRREASRTRATYEAPDVGGRTDLWRALQNLPPRQRAAIVLRFYEDLSEQEAADVLRCSKASLNSLVHRGMELLRSQISEEDR